jgi:hypothetical protein
MFAEFGTAPDGEAYGAKLAPICPIRDIPQPPEKGTLSSRRCCMEEMDVPRMRARSLPIAIRADSEFPAVLQSACALLVECRSAVIARS